MTHATATVVDTEPLSPPRAAGSEPDLLDDLIAAADDDSNEINHAELLIEIHPRSYKLRIKQDPTPTAGPGLRVRVVDRRS